MAGQEIAESIPRKRNNKKQSTSPSGRAATVLDRNNIGANWQNFMANQTVVDRKPHQPKKTGAEIENSDAYWKAKRLEKKDNLKMFPNNNNKSTGVASGENSVGKRKSSQPTLTKFVAIDCEMVGIGNGGNDNMLARVSLVNKFGDCIYDKFVMAREKVIDYRTPVSGIRKEDMLNGEPFDTVQREVAELLKDKTLVGHALKNDLDVLFLSHPRRRIRDTARYKPFKKITKGSTPSLKRLSKELLGVTIQGGEHSSIEDARAAMQLYCLHAREWEASLQSKTNKRNSNTIY